MTGEPARVVCFYLPFHLYVLVTVSHFHQCYGMILATTTTSQVLVSLTKATV